MLLGPFGILNFFMHNAYIDHKVINVCDEDYGQYCQFSILMNSNPKMVIFARIPLFYFISRHIESATSKVPWNCTLRY